MTVVKHLPTQMVAAPAAPPVVEAPEENDPEARAPDRYADDDEDDDDLPRGYDRYGRDRYDRYDRYGDQL